MNKVQRRAWGRQLPGNDARTDNGENTMADEQKSEVKVGTVEKSGKTRGKNPRDITYQAFDTSVPESLPKSLKEFMEVTQTKTEAEMLEYVIDGYNAAQYAAASDEIGEFINDAWDKETQNQFRLAVRNYSKLTGLSIEDAVNLIKPGVEKAFQAKKVAASQATQQPATVGAQLAYNLNSHSYYLQVG